MNGRFGRFVKPEATKDANQELASYAALVQELVNTFNDRQRGMTDDMFKMFVYEIVITKFVKSRMRKEWAADKIWDIFVDFVAECFQRMHLQMPSLGMRELAIAFVVARNTLLIPE